MQGPSHLVISWFVAEASGLESARNRRIVALAGLAPDIDVVAYIAAYVYFGFDRELAYSKVWVTVHHYYTHGIGFAVLTAIAAYALAARPHPKFTSPPSSFPWDAPIGVAALAMLMSLGHVFCDIVAAGSRFPVYPLWPLSDLAWTVSWSWELRDWPNQIITIVCLFAVIIYARYGNRSPLESLSYRLDAWVVSIARQSPQRAPAHAEKKELILGMRRSTFVRLAIYTGLALVSAIVILPVSSDLF